MFLQHTTYPQPPPGSFATTYFKRKAGDAKRKLHELLDCLDYENEFKTEVLENSNPSQMPERLKTVSIVEINGHPDGVGDEAAQAVQHIEPSRSRRTFGTAQASRKSTRVFGRNVLILLQLKTVTPAAQRFLC